MGQSRTLRLTDWTSANNALMQYFEGNTSKLAKHVKMSRTTVTSFLKQRAIGESSFRKICLALRLNWEHVSSVDHSLDSSEAQSSFATQPRTLLLEQVRERCHQKILRQHSRIRLLSGKEIIVDQLYVDVWLLEKPEHRDFSTLESILNDYNITEDRLSVSKRLQRKPGLEIVDSTSKLIIFGKPGSGKTTFLKHLAVDWVRGNFHAEKIAVLIELRQIRLKEWRLIDAISQELELIEEETLDLLKQGILLILMDGLDEVPNAELRSRLQSQVENVSKKYSSENRFVLTCRTQAVGKSLKGFTEVEVAEFNSKQVTKFVQNWFTAYGLSETEVAKQCETIQVATINQPDLGEIAVTPVLLALICVVWQDSGKIPRNRANLYRKGVNWLLSRWNDNKGIQDWEFGTEVYRRLSIEDKEALLIDIAARKFENPDNFVLFEQDELVRQISQKLLLEQQKTGVAVLKAIEAQHGLLIERADELWSFSHLTFQEFFTVQWLVRLSSQQLADKISNRQWQRAVEQIVKSQQPADRLLRLLKHAVDQLVAQDYVIQAFLSWVFQKSGSSIPNCKAVAVRAFHCSRTRTRACDLARSFEDSFSCALNHALDFDCALKLDLAQISACELDVDQSVVFDLFSSHHRTYLHSLVLDIDRSIALARDLDRTLNMDLALARFLKTKNPIELVPGLVNQLCQLQDDLPISDPQIEVHDWWPVHGIRWIEKLRQLMIDYQDSGYDWRLTRDKQFHHYYEANIFLVKIMNIAGAVSANCRTEIEESLLLPWAELHKRQPDLYEDLENAS